MENDLPDLPIEIAVSNVLPPDVLLMLPSSNPRNLSPQEMIERGEAVVARLEDGQ